MTTTEQPQMNGHVEGGKYIDSIDVDDPEYIRQMRRPAEVKEDVAQMAHRQRVSLILTSQSFRDELEHIVQEYSKGDGASALSIEAIHKQISELILPQTRFQHTSGITKAAVAGAIVPIADIRGGSTLHYSKGERMLRCKVASCYRLLDLFGWVNSMNNIITARISQEHEHFLTAPSGLLYHEITAASLLKADMQGETVDSGSTNLGLNHAAYTVHTAIHQFRPDIKAIIHLRTPAAVAVSSMKCGLMPICHEAILLGDVSIYDYTGALETAEERDKLARTLGPINKVLLLRNHGVLVGGENVEEAFYLAKNITSACDTQVQIMPIGLDNIIVPSEEVRRQTFEDAEQKYAEAREAGEGRRRWRKGEMEFEALMRHLDNAGLRTGHLYHEPLVKRLDRREKINDEVEIPPSATACTYLDEDGKYMSPAKAYMANQKQTFRTEWLNTPNVYMKEEFDETGTPNPKKITKWVPGQEDKGRTPVKLENPNQFAPIGPNPHELREKHKSIRKEYYEEKISAGPQSKILEGMTWEEAQRIKEQGLAPPTVIPTIIVTDFDSDGHVSGTADQHIIVGAVSKGIIQRDHQHNATVYKQYYAPNPFDHMNEQEVEQYKKDIEMKVKGVTTTATDTETTLSPGPDGKLISTEERMTHVRGDDVQGSPSQTQDFKRAASERYTPQRSQQLVQELNTNFERSKSERKPKGKRGKDKSITSVNGEDPASPTKSTSSAEGASAPGSPTKEAPSKEKKKKKFRMPSFSKKKDKK